MMKFKFKRAAWTNQKTTRHYHPPALADSNINDTTHLQTTCNASGHVSL
jgi:hypothetical protein